MKSTLASSLLFGAASAVLDVDLTSSDSIKSAARQIANNLMSYYHGNQTGQTPGILPGPPPAGDYYWWEAGAMWGTLVDYWHYTGDTTYNQVASDSLIFQAGAPQNAYMPANWTASLGNDDQGFWGMSAMLAAENKFPDPPEDQPQWLELAQAVFNTQQAPDRHDNSCGGGLRWQIPFANNGYNYKNSIANGIFINMGARLYRYTGNETYANWVYTTWDWMLGVGFLDAQYNVYDGAHTDDNCTDIAKPQFTYNAGVFLQAAAFMWNTTQMPEFKNSKYAKDADLWKKRVNGLTSRTIQYFFHSGVPIEQSCERPEGIQCKTDMLSFKGYLLRWMAQTTQLAPYTHDTIMTVLRSAAAAAMKSCNGPVCGFRWTTGGYDSNTGVGQQMNALASLISLLADQKTAGQLIQGPVTNSTGGTSKGDYNAGNKAMPSELTAITTADKAGASILTILAIGALISTISWMSTAFWEGGKNW